MEIDALNALFRLHANERRLRGVQGKLLLCDEPKIRAADLEPGPHNVKGTLLVRQRLHEDLLTLTCSELGGERVFNIAERPNADSRVRGDRFLLLRSPDIHLRFQRASLVDWGEQVRTNAPNDVGES